MPGPWLRHCQPPFPTWFGYYIAGLIPPVAVHHHRFNRRRCSALLSHARVRGELGRRGDVEQAVGRPVVICRRVGRGSRSKAAAGGRVSNAAERFGDHVQDEVGVSLPGVE